MRHNHKRTNMRFYINKNDMESIVYIQESDPTDTHDKHVWYVRRQIVPITRHRPQLLYTCDTYDEALDKLDQFVLRTPPLHERPYKVLCYTLGKLHRVFRTADKETADMIGRKYIDEYGDPFFRAFYQVNKEDM